MVIKIVDDYPDKMLDLSSSFFVNADQAGYSFWFDAH
jgi:hypothetical protein